MLATRSSHFDFEPSSRAGSRSSLGPKHLVALVGKSIFVANHPTALHEGLLVGAGTTAAASVATKQGGDGCKSARREIEQGALELSYVGRS